MADEKDPEFEQPDVTTSAKAEGFDATGADTGERAAKDELFEAIDHFKNAASILFGRAAKDPAVKTATKEAGRVVKQIGDAAEPVARELTKEMGRMTQDMLSLVERTRKRFDEEE